MNQFAAILPRTNAVPVVKLCASEEEATREAVILARRSVGLSAYVAKLTDEYRLFPRELGHTSLGITS